MTINATVVNQSKDRKISAFNVSENLFKKHPKDILKFIKMSGEWAKIAFKDLDTLPSLKAFTDSITTGEKTLSFVDFGASISRLGENITSINEHNLNISGIRTSAFDSIWNFHKVVKWFHKCNVITFGTKFLTNITTLGGIAFGINSIEKIYTESKRLFKHKDQNEITRTYLLLKISKSICTLAVGVFVTLNALFGFVAPGIIMLVLGTLILTYNFSSNMLNETYKIEDKLFNQ
ncbi:MAG: hypothetical protein A3F40_00715 [Chlamydiae bacterium RIFCSPHIGHO2_12_FULL_27_8]|nr:MAG: hypothetical protein A3F40_00715 [Chlamydiae bacterium RIFCSPHIGHO2_12_FULL_27_8]